MPVWTETIVYFFFEKVLIMSHFVVILNVNLSNINLGDNFDEDDSDIIILITKLAWHNK